MRNAPIETGGRTLGGSSAPATVSPRPAEQTTPRILATSFLFLTAEGGQRYRVDELFREIGRRGRIYARLTPYAWGLGGFLIGAIFWHFVGFWGFLGATVLNRPEAPVTVVARPAQVPAGVSNCTVLALNRSTGRTYSIPCPEPMPAFDEASSERQDFAAIPSR